MYVYADEFDAYIIVSFVNATLVLSIGETVEEVTDSGFLGTTPTLGCSSLGDNALLQVLNYFFIIYLSFFKQFSIYRFTQKVFDTFELTGELMSGSHPVNEQYLDVQSINVKLLFL